MKIIGWIFLVLNIIVSVGCLWSSASSYNRLGDRELNTPGVWIWIWQLIGVAISLLLHFSPWHLFWWFPAGCIIIIVTVKSANRLGCRLWK